MDKVKKIKELLEILDLPKKQQTDICTLTILSMANLKKRTKWEEATNEWLRIHDIIAFANRNYNVSYAENSRETFRKQALHHFRNAAIVEDNAMATNSPNYRWRLTDEFVEIIRNINISDDPLIAFKNNHAGLKEIYASKKEMKKMPRNLTIILIISILIFIIYVLFEIKHNKLNIKNAIIWIIMGICIVFCTLQIEAVKVLAKIIGIEKASNMIFFLGFIFLIFTCFNITQTISIQNRKIIKLTQDLAILRNEIEKNDKK